MATTTFNDLITFSRGSNATVTGPNGLIQWAPANLLTNSQDFEASAWVKTNATVTANAATAPDGTTTAEEVFDNATANIHRVGRADNVTVSGTTYTASAYFKKSTLSQACLYSYGWSRGVGVDLNTGTQITVTGISNADPANVSITDAGNGWWRVTMSGAATGAANIAIFTISGSAFSYAGSGESLFVWGAQLELGSTATTYNNTSVRNLLGFSEAFDNAAWTKSASSIVTGAQANPVNGLFNAQKLMEDTTTANHGTQQSVTLVAVPYVYSVYLKAAGRSWAQLVNGSVGNCFAYFDLANGAVGTVGAGATSAAITAVGSGWYRCSILFTAASGGNIIIARNASANGTTSYTGDGNSGVYIYGAMLSNSASLDPYVPTPGAAPSSTAYYGPRFDYDPVTLLPRGLLVEEARTNLLLYSEQFDNAAWSKSAAAVTANAAVAPDGTTTADKIVPTATTAQHYIQANITSAASTYTMTVYAKADGYRWLWFNATSTGAPANDLCWFDVLNGVVGTAQSGATTSIQNVGNGWFRCVCSWTAFTVGAPVIWIAVAGADNQSGGFTANGTDGIFLWGAQLEAGAFATSYIPTIASTVTRSADVATITGSLFSQWYNQPAGSFIVVADSPGVSGAANITTVDDGTLNERIRILTDVLDPKVIVTDGGVTQANIDAGAITALQPFNMSAAYALNDIAACLNGGTVGTDTSATLPTVTILRAGADSAGNYLNGHIRSIRYVPVRAADFQLQQVTT
jgi:hypothetical protein